MVGESRSHPHRRIHISIHPSISMWEVRAEWSGRQGQNKQEHVEEVGTRAMARLDFTGMSGLRWQNSRTRLARNLPSWARDRTVRATPFPPLQMGSIKEGRGVYG